MQFISIHKEHIRSAYSQHILKFHGLSSAVFCLKYFLIWCIGDSLLYDFVLLILITKQSSFFDLLKNGLYQHLLSVSSVEF